MADSAVHLRPTSILFEVVTDTAAGVRVAAANGADRIELVSALGVGGVTPSVGLMRLAATVACPVRVMIRPRAGDFTYDGDELDIMRRDIDDVHACGLAGVVFGANLASGALDEAALRQLVAHADALGLESALHRSFDLTPGPLQALDVAIGLGIRTVLTSGGAKSAREGVGGLAKYVNHARGRIEILAGIGVTADNVIDIVRLSGVSSVHSSCIAPQTGPTPQANTDRDELLNALRANQRDTSPACVAGMREALDSIKLTQGHGGRQ